LYFFEETLMAQAIADAEAGCFDEGQHVLPVGCLPGLLPFAAEESLGPLPADLAADISEQMLDPEVSGALAAPVEPFEIAKQEDLEDFNSFVDALSAEQSVHVNEHEVGHLVIEDVFQGYFVPFEEICVEDGDEMLKLHLFGLLVEDLLDVLNEVHEDYEAHGAQFEQGLKHEDGLVKFQFAFVDEEGAGEGGPALEAEVVDGGVAGFHLAASVAVVQHR
jgi:SAM-dependent methyltransferase